MSQKKSTIASCTEEIERLLKIMLYGKCDKDDEKNIKQQLKYNLEEKARLEKIKMENKEQAKAEREANKLGIRSWATACRERGIL